MDKFQWDSASPLGLLPQLKQYAPDTDVLVAAVQQLTDGLKMRGFFREYISSLEQAGCNNPEKTAYENLARILSDLTPEKRILWRCVFLKLKDYMITNACEQTAGLVREIIPQ